MSGGYQSGTTEISGNVSVSSSSSFPTPSATQTIVNYGASGTTIQSASDTLIRTNTASKVFYMTHMQVYAGGGFTMTIKDNGTTLYVVGNIPTGTVAPLVLEFATPLKFSTNVQFRANAGTPQIYFGFTGWEE